MTETLSEQAVDAAKIGDRLAILELTSNLGLLVDARDWAGLQALFTDPVAVDYTSLNGGEPLSPSPADLIAGWRSILDNLRSTQHLIAGQVITLAGDGATCAANVQATHVLPNSSGGPLWTVAGRYDFGLTRTPAGWRVSALTLTVQWASGNRHVMTLAAG